MAVELHPVSTQSTSSSLARQSTVNHMRQMPRGRAIATIAIGDHCMTTGPDRTTQWNSWTIEIKVWKLLAALVILPILVLWFKVVHQDDEILALVRNEVVTDAADQRAWAGSFVNTNDSALRDVAVTVNFLDSQDRVVGKADTAAAELPFGTRLDLQVPLPRDAVRLRIYSVQWRMGRRAVMMGPFREPWEFGYLMADPARLGR
jgi:hypothetical protein